MPRKCRTFFTIFQNFTSQTTKCNKMQSILKLAVLLCAIALAIAYPRGAVQVDDNEAEPAARLERHSGGGGHHHEVVDFGAHTGHKGSFGWYADFPVHSHH